MNFPLFISFWGNIKYIVIPCPPYSLILGSVDLFLFQKMESLDVKVVVLIQWIKLLCDVPTIPGNLLDQMHLYEGHLRKKVSLFFSPKGSCACRLMKVGELLFMCSGSNAKTSSPLTKFLRNYLPISRQVHELGGLSLMSWNFEKFAQGGYPVCCFLNNIKRREFLPHASS